MKRLIYRSLSFGFDHAILAGILTGAWRNNRRDEITGALICRHDLYMQLIEDPAPVIDALYSRIAVDDRHGDARLLATNMVSQRLCPQLEMLDDEAPSLLFSSTEVAESAIDATRPAELLGVFRRLSASTDVRGGNP